MSEGSDIREFKRVIDPKDCGCHPTEVVCRECGVDYPLDNDILLNGCPVCRDKIFKSWDRLEKTIKY